MATAAVAGSVADDDGHGCGGAYIWWPITTDLHAEFDWRWLYMDRCTFGVDDLLGCFCRILHGFFATY